MTAVHYNQAVDLRITNVEQFIAGKKYLMVHNRRDGELDFAPPYCSEVWAIGTEHTSFNELDRRAGRPIHFTEPSTKPGLENAYDHVVTSRWFLFYVTDEGGYQSNTCASDHGFSESEPRGHSMNYILDLQALKARGIEILREVSPGTNMKYERQDDWYDDFDSLDGGYY